MPGLARPTAHSFTTCVVEHCQPKHIRLLEKQRIIDKVSFKKAMHQGGSSPNIHPFEL